MPFPCEIACRLEVAGVGGKLVGAIYCGYGLSQTIKMYGWSGLVWAPAGWCFGSGCKL